MRKVSGIIAAAALVASVALVGPAANAGETIAGAGSSYMSAIQKVCAAAYTAHTVTYSPDGSGTGKTKFAAGTTQFGGSDSLYAPGTEPANFTYVPLVGGPIGIIFNVDGLTNVNLTPKLISAIFLGKITKWNDAAIAKVNKASASKLPDAQIQIVYRSGTSGTNENLSEYLRQNVTTAGWTKNQTITTAAGALATGSVGKATSALLADAVESSANKGAFGYFDLSDAKTANVSLVSLKNKHGEFVAPSASAGALFLNAQTTDNSGSDRVQGTATANLPAALGGTVNGVIDFTKSVKNAYQLTILTYGIGDNASTDAADVAVEDFFKFVINTCMPAQASRLGYVALTGSLKTKALAQAARIAQ